MRRSVAGRLLRQRQRRLRTADGPPEGWLRDANPVLHVEELKRRELWGAKGSDFVAHGEEVDTQGPQVEPAFSQKGYAGNYRTPAWLLGEDGEEIAAKCRAVFTPLEPTRKKKIGRFKMLLTPGRATSAPPVGPTFAGQGVPAIEFVKQFNDKTAGIFAADPALKLHVEVWFYEDKSYQYLVEPPPLHWMLERLAGLSHAEWPTKSVMKTDEYIDDNESVRGYLTLQQLYHLAAIYNTWSRPDSIGLEQRVLRMVERAYRHGILVLGVHTPLPPRVGMTDAQQLEWIKSERDKQLEKRREELVANPLESTPWAERLQLEGVNFDLSYGDIPKKQLLKDAQAIDKKFQKLVEKEVSEREQNQSRVRWEEWKQSGIMSKNKDKPTMIERRQIVNAQHARVEYLKRFQKATLSNTPHYGAMWFSDDWEQHQSNSLQGPSAVVR